MIDVIAIFDIGKTNKKFLLFNAEMKLLFQEEEQYDEIKDDDDFPCDDIERLEKWMHNTLSKTIKAGVYTIKALNFSTYGASLMYLDDEGKRLTPVYNYLKPMPDGVLNGFYENFGGVEEFSRITASPALGMLNSGLQALWLKKQKPEVFQKVKTILHFPQYLSTVFTKQLVSEYTSIGCHTALWNFDENKYHQWIEREGIQLPEPISNSTVFDVTIENEVIKTGIGIHDSSASLVPYIMGTKEQFILISTGTWCIFMNPFNPEPLTTDQLRSDSLCYMSVQQQQVKSSRLFMGHIHDVNVERLTNHFQVEPGYYKRVKANSELLSQLHKKSDGRIFFNGGVPESFIDNSVNLSAFATFDEAYHQFMIDLVDLAMEAYGLIIPENDQTQVVYISGGFARSELFVTLMSARISNKKVYTSEIDNTSALGAMMVVWEHTFGKQIPTIDLGLKSC